MSSSKLIVVSPVPEEFVQEQPIVKQLIVERHNAIIVEQSIVDQPVPEVQPVPEEQSIVEKFSQLTLTLSSKGADAFSALKESASPVISATCEVTCDTAKNLTAVACDTATNLVASADTLRKEEPYTFWGSLGAVVAAATLVVVALSTTTEKTPEEMGGVPAHKWGGQKNNKRQ